MTVSHYRLATPADAGGIVAVVEMAYRSKTSPGWTTEAHLVSGTRTSVGEISEILQRADSCMLIGEIDDNIISCCLVTKISDIVVHLGMFCVEPSRQGTRLGGELLRRAIYEAQRRFGAAKVTLNVLATREELRRWYERFGFVPTGERLPFSYEIDPMLALVADLEFIVYERQIDSIESQPID